MSSIVRIDNDIRSTARHKYDEVSRAQIMAAAMLTAICNGFPINTIFQLLP